MQASNKGLSEHSRKDLIMQPRHQSLDRTFQIHPDETMTDQPMPLPHPVTLVSDLHDDPSKFLPTPKDAINMYEEKHYDVSSPDPMVRPRPPYQVPF